MVNSTIALVELTLQRDRFGPTTLKQLPMDGIKGASHHNIKAATEATRKYRVGEICTVWHPGGSADSIAGFTEFVYGRFDLDANGTAAIAQVLSPSLITNLFDFGHDEGQVACGGFGVISISVLTDDYYGWFWSGGVAPIDFVADSANFASDSTVDTTGGVAELTGFYATTDGSNDQALVVCAAGFAQMGIALADDD